MATPHNEAKKEDIAKKVIMPGDPLRAKYIAENYLKDYKLVNTVRCMYAYTGYYNGEKVTVMAHGMGNPSIGIYSYELFNFYDVDEIIRVGSCGALTKSLKLKDVILALSSYSISSYAKVSTNYLDNTIESNNELNNKIINTANNINIKLISGNVYNTDVFYNDNDDINDLYNNKKCLAIEMESFALFYNAKILNKKAACLLSVSDNVVTKEELSSYDRQTSFDEMIKLALEVITS